MVADAKVVRITAAKLDGTAVYIDFILPVLNNDIILFSVQKQHNHQSHYKVEAKGGREATENEVGALCPLQHFKLFLEYNKGTSSLSVLKCNNVPKCTKKQKRSVNLYFGMQMRTHEAE
jgi:hypothetical protein